MTKQPEGKLSKKIIDALHARGAYVWKVHGNEYTPAGTPDIVGVYKGQFIAVETKMPGNELTAIQRYRIARMRTAGALVVAPCRSVEEATALIDRLWDLYTATPDSYWWHDVHGRIQLAYGSAADREG